MKPFLSALTLIALFFSPLHSLAQPASSKSLLWRITGNGLQKPSYLYGTMHLKDRRLFFFTDSVYNGIATSQGFAMELDPEEMMDSLFTKLGQGDTTTLLRKMLDEKKFKSVAKKLEKKFGMPADKISRRQLLADRQNWYSRIHKNDDMQSIVDLYLYNIAHKQGKVVGGIEDVNDQMSIIDEMGKDVSINELVEDSSDTKRKDYLENMVKLYTDQDIGKIDELFSGSELKKTKDLLLLTRNIKMAQRMDSLSHIRNSFFAVGVAHLPGEGGVIQLLQRKGFTVEPVFSSKKIAPEKYEYTPITIPWVKFTGDDSAYTVEMPGKPSDLKAPGAELNFKVYADLVTNIVYMSAFTFLGTSETPEESIERMSKSFFANGFENTGKKKITKNGLEGVEFMATRQNIFYRFQFFPVTGKLFMLIEGAGKNEDVHSKDVERFLSSFTMNNNVTARPTTWVTYKNELQAFEVSFPKKPGIDNLPPAETGTKLETSTYTLMDIPTNTYYLVVVSDTKKGFVMNEDSVIFNAKLDYYKNNKSIVRNVRNFLYSGNGAMSFEAQTTTDGIDYISKILIVCRGNRNYTVAAITQKGREDFPDVTHFFNSFTLSPFKEKRWAKTTGNSGVFSTWAPSGFEYRAPDTAGLADYEIKEKLMAAKKELPFVAHDAYASISYNVDVYPMSKYYWTKNDSSFIASQLAMYYSDTSGYYAKKHPGRFDSLVYIKPVTNGGVKGVEILVRNAGESYCKRVRVLPHGDSAYHIFLLAPTAFISNENSNKYFDDFRFSNEGLPSALLENKTALILNDLQSSDSATKEAASTALRQAKFDTTSLPLLYKAYLKKYASDSSEYQTMNEKIATAIGSVKDSSVLSFVKENYITGTVSAPELKTGMLQLLAGQHTLAATILLKELLLTSPPVKGDINSIIYQLADSLLLCKTLFPEAARLFGDSLAGPGMIELAVKLVDSNLLQKDIVLQNQEGIFTAATRQLASGKKDGYSYLNQYIIDALGKINNKKSVDLLNRYVKVKALDIKENAVMALLKIKQPVPALEIHKIAADNTYRVSFYKELLSIDRQELFPADLLTQQLFAESYLYGNASDEEEEDATFKFVEERVALIKGIQKRYFLFKTSAANDGETTSHLAICGPFDMNRKNILLKENEESIKIFYDDKYAVADINKFYLGFIDDEQKASPMPIK